MSNIKDDVLKLLQDKIKWDDLVTFCEQYYSNTESWPCEETITELLFGMYTTKEVKCTLYNKRKEGAESGIGSGIDIQIVLNNDTYQYTFIQSTS